MFSYMTATDPTMKIFDLLADESLWHIERNVPIFRPHKRYDRDGKFLYEVTTKELPSICDNTLALRDSGVFPRITLGHTIPGGPQEIQPRIIGYAANPRIGKFGPGGIESILGDEYIRREYWEEAKSYPYRSVEYYRRRGIITGIALLKVDPELDLGMIVYEKSGDLVFYSREVQMEGENPTPWVKHEEAKESQPHPDEKEKEVAINENDKAHFMAYARHCFPHLERIHSEHAERYMAEGGPGMPSSTNVVEPKMAPPDPNIQRMQREEDAIRYKQLEDRATAQDALITKLRADLEAEQYARREARAEQQVTQLQGEGYQIKDRAKLVKKIAAITDDAVVTEALAEIRENYQRIAVPIPGMEQYGRQIPIDRSNNGPKPSGPSRQKHEQAVSLATKEKISYEEALQKVTA